MEAASHLQHLGCQPYTGRALSFVSPAVDVGYASSKLPDGKWFPQKNVKKIDSTITHHTSNLHDSPALRERFNTSRETAVTVPAHRKCRWGKIERHAPRISTSTR
jgi:hypothetical protein